ncbi:MAG TPA: DoxX family protein [Terracidiphilus sp.]|jgi:hypothetical protein|nr:DoxX family protein [Terracidiphilus sp.]
MAAKQDGDCGGGPVGPPKGWLWSGRVVTTLAVLFLLVDAAGKVAMPKPVVDACVRLGFPTNLGMTLAILLGVSTLLYAIPKTAVLGAILLTGYLGGAVAIHVRAGSSTFETVFPVILGVVVWAGVYLRECRLWAVFPIRR